MPIKVNLLDKIRPTKQKTIPFIASVNFWFQCKSWTTLGFFTFYSFYVRLFFFVCVCVCVFHFWLNGASQLTFSLLKKFPCRPQEFSSFELPAAWRGKLSFFFWMEEISRFELHALLAHSVVHINICLIRHFSYFISCS